MGNDLSSWTRAMGGGAGHAAPAPKKKSAKKSTSAEDWVTKLLGGKLAAEVYAKAGKTVPGSAAKPTRIPLPNPVASMSLDDLLGQAVGMFPGAATITPNLIDLAQVSAPYVEARTNLGKQADTNRESLKQYAAQSQQDLVAQQAISKMAGERYTAENDAIRSAALQAIQGQANAGVASMQAQGMSGAPVGQMVGGQMAQVQDHGAAANAYQKQMSAEQALEAQRAGVDSKNLDRSANVALDQSLMGGMASLNADEAKARSSAEMANNEAVQQAAVANAAAAQGSAEQAMQVRAALMERLQMDPSAYLAPQRNQVLQDLDSYKASNPDSSAADLVLAAVNTPGVTTEDEAASILAKLLQDETERTGKQFSRAWFTDKLRRYYDIGSNPRINSSAAASILGGLG